MLRWRKQTDPQVPAAVDSVECLVSLPLAGFNTPSGSEIDSLWNYEVGMRASGLDRRLQADLMLTRVLGWFDAHL